jgi:uncharacterized protein (DUF342 family)
MKHFGLRTLALVSLLTSNLLYSALAVVPQKSTEQTSAGSSQVASTKDSTQNCPDADQLRKNVQQLTAEVQRLRSRVALLEKDRLATTIQEQLEKEEQRGESLQLHLLQIADKEAPLQARLDQVNQQLKPEALEQLMAGVGSVHPEDAREEVRKRLSNEKVRIQSQLDLLRQDRVRTQASLATTDAAIQRLKQKLAEALR